MRRLSALPFLVLAFTACSSGGQDELTASQSDPLINGHVATEAEYPATVDFGSGCTGVKVGPRHFLSAGHCFKGSTQARLTVTANNNAQNFLSLSISSINLQPNYLNCVGCDGSGNDYGLQPDVSLVIVHELTPDIPQAVIDPTAAVQGDPVTLTGYGCENGVGQPSGPARLKVGDSQVADPMALSDSPNIPGAYVTTLGPFNVPGAPAICPGDSGGPLYRTGTNKVVGVNSTVVFGGDDKGTPYGSLHARLDQASRYNVYAWLTNLIAQPVPAPCDGVCTAPTVFTTQYYSSQNIGTSARCFETTAPLISGNCGGFVAPRTLKNNGAAMACTGQNWVLPATHNGGYCFSTQAGQNSYAWFSTF